MQVTDDDWKHIGEHEPFFGVLSNPKFLRRNLSEEALKEFWLSGVDDLDHVLATFRRHFGDISLSSAIDFGCGVGRLTKAMASHCDRVYGVDVSPGMLAVAREHAVENMELSETIPDLQVDWVHSAIVMQHIPPLRGYPLFETLLDRIKSGGVFSIHVTLFKGQEYLPHLFNSLIRGSWDGETLRHVVQKDVGAGAILMFDYELTRLLMIALARGFHSFWMDHSNHGGCHGVMIYSRRS